ncbi:hypothetical protein BRADI_2g10051v3 [Brachypodium distachyon]|uniref:Uncharacterized protein n=1 Tax=Brachypodium distachyon TaxID=15368 RepID=A0A2K2D7S6_BRADI|nr:hypothetical protein BRADI_2g10051v3 [Brachypodium distachyon]PNT70330.1 hypothetical protein BRADI_2g10051v3 [Brachypodium distachyon]
MIPSGERHLSYGTARCRPSDPPDPLLLFSSYRSFSLSRIPSPSLPVSPILLKIDLQNQPLGLWSSRAGRNLGLQNQPAEGRNSARAEGRSRPGQRGRRSARAGGGARRGPRGRRSARAGGGGVCGRAAEHGAAGVAEEKGAGAAQGRSRCGLWLWSTARLQRQQRRQWRILARARRGGLPPPPPSPPLRSVFGLRPAKVVP